MSSDWPRPSMARSLARFPKPAKMFPGDDPVSSLRQSEVGRGRQRLFCGFVPEPIRFCRSASLTMQYVVPPQAASQEIQRHPVWMKVATNSGEVILHEATLGIRLHLESGLV